MITLDHETERKLREVFGQDLDGIAREALIAEGYRKGKLSIGQAASLLKLSVNDTYGLMKQRGIAVNYTLSDLETDCASLRELRKASR